MLLENFRTNICSFVQIFHNLQYGIKYVDFYYLVPKLGYPTEVWTVVLSDVLNTPGHFLFLYPEEQTCNKFYHCRLVIWHQSQ